MPAPESMFVNRGLLGGVTIFYDLDKIYEATCKSG
jgi:hypothetical protein